MATGQFPIGDNPYYAGPGVAQPYTVGQGGVLRIPTTPSGPGVTTTAQPKGPNPYADVTQRAGMRFGGRGISEDASQAIQGIPGVSRLAYAGAGQEAVDTGLPKEIEAAYILAQQAFASAQPGLYGPGGIIQRGGELADIMRGAVPGVQDWMRQQAAFYGGLQGQQAGQVQAGQSAVQNALGQLAALRGGAGVAGSRAAAQQAAQALSGTGLQLTPEMQQLVEQERQLALQRAQVGTERQTQDALSQLQAVLGGRGLGASSIASRGAGDVLSQAAERQETARLAAEQQALQRELGLRELGLQERGQTIQGALGLTTGALAPEQFMAGVAGTAGQLGLGLGGQGLQGLEQAGLGLQAYGLPAQSQAEIGLLSQALGLERGLRQEQIAPELQALQIALGSPVQQEGPGLGEVLGQLGGAVLGAGGQIGASYAGRG